VFNGDVIYRPTEEASKAHKNFDAYQRLASGTGRLEDLHLCYLPIFEKIFSAANANPYGLLWIDVLQTKHAERILAAAKPILKHNLLPLEEKIFLAKQSGDQFYENLEHLDRIYETVWAQYTGVSARRSIFWQIPLVLKKSKSHFFEEPRDSSKS
jgi:hypothetical protein